VPFATLPKEVSKDPMDFLEKYGTPCGREMTFPPGKIFHFFECLMDVTSLDVLQLIGGGRVGGPYPHEDELSCGGAEREVVMVLVAKIGAIARGDDAKRADVIQKAKNNFLDAKWFVNTLYVMKEALEEALGRNGSVMALFE